MAAGKGTFTDGLTDTVYRGRWENGEL